MLILVIVAVLLFKYSDFGKYLTFNFLKAESERLQELVEQRPLLSSISFFTIYIFTTAFSIPGATVLTLAAGAFFGFWWGTLIVSFASTIGATGSFIISRFLFRDFVKERFSERLEVINLGITREGSFYLFALRLIPLFPFFVINALMGLTSIKVSTFFWVSQLGMLPGTLAYINAGTQLGNITSTSDIVSWPILISFSIIGVIPILAKRIITAVRTNHILARFKRPSEFDYNVVVLGAGSAGLVAAYIAATLKAKVALIEKDKMGGDCLNTGCVPSKSLIHTAKLLSQIRKASSLGLSDRMVEFDFAAIMKNVRSIITRIEPHDSPVRYAKLGVECISGHGHIVSPYLVRVNDRELRTKSIIIATGATPKIPSIPGLEKIPYLTSETIWNINELPKRMLVLGGGPIGVELAQCFCRLGSRVTLVERSPSLLPREDSDASKLIEDQFLAEGIKVLTSHEAVAFRTSNSENFALLENRSNAEQENLELGFDQVLIALGRTPRTSGFGIEELSIELSNSGRIDHNIFLKTNYPNIYACGDVAGPYQFTHTASFQAWHAVANALFSPFWQFRADYRVIPWCTFCDPQVARVGLSENEASDKGIKYEVTKYELKELDRAITDHATNGFVKVLTKPKSDQILGATIVSEHAGEQIAEFVTAMKFRIGLSKILSTIHIYPTFTEGNKNVAGQWKRAHINSTVMKIISGFHAWRRG